MSTRAKTVWVIDEATARRNAIAKLVRSLDLDVAIAEQPAEDELVGVIGHHPDLERSGASQACRVPVVHYRGEIFVVPAAQRGHYSFPFPVNRTQADVEQLEHSFEEVFVWMRDGGAPPQFLIRSEDVLETLLPFAVLLDGYRDCADGADIAWFRPATAATLSPSRAGGMPSIPDSYWQELGQSDAASERLARVLAAPSGTTPALRKLLQRTCFQLPNSGSRDLHLAACAAVERAWKVFSGGTFQGREASETAGSNELHELVEDASAGFHLLALALFDWGRHPLIQDASRLRHTSIGNLWSPLFSPERRLGTQRVLTGAAAPDEFPDTRDRLAKWPSIRESFHANLRALDTQYTPFSAGVAALEAHMDKGLWERVARQHGIRVRELIGMAQFVHESRTALARFCDGLDAVVAGTKSVAELSQLHGESQDAYSIQRLLAQRRGT